MRRALVLIVISLAQIANVLSSSQVARERQSLKIALVAASETSGIHAVAVPFLESEQVAMPATPVSEKAMEAWLQQVVAKLSLPARLVKVMLPRPVKGRNWTAEELLAYAEASAKLFNAPVGEVRPGVEIMGRLYNEEAIKPTVGALDLRPVYVVALRHNWFGGTWDSTYGEMRLVQQGAQVTGEYRTNGGRIQGTVVGNELRFRWHEPTSNTLGFGYLKLSSEGMSFSGLWFNDENPTAPAGTWTGKRISR